LSADAELAGAPFGPALPLESYDDAGRIGGDIIYVADLGDRNQVLKDRFPNRQWYRMVLQRTTQGTLVPRLARY
jgi:hypothetical protein